MPNLVTVMTSVHTVVQMLFKLEYHFLKPNLEMVVSYSIIADVFQVKVLCFRHQVHNNKELKPQLEAYQVLDVLILHIKLYEPFIWLACSCWLLYHGSGEKYKYFILKI